MNNNFNVNGFLSKETLPSPIIEIPKNGSDEFKKLNSKILDTKNILDLLKIIQSYQNITLIDGTTVGGKTIRSRVEDYFKNDLTNSSSYDIDIVNLPVFKEHLSKLIKEKEYRIKLQKEEKNGADFAYEGEDRLHTEWLKQRRQEEEQERYQKYTNENTDPNATGKKLRSKFFSLTALKDVFKKKNNKQDDDNEPLHLPSWEEKDLPTPNKVATEPFEDPLHTEWLKNTKENDGRNLSENLLKEDKKSTKLKSLFSRLKKPKKATEPIPHNLVTMEDNAGILPDKRENFFKDLHAIYESAAGTKKDHLESLEVVAKKLENVKAVTAKEREVVKSKLDTESLNFLSLLDRGSDFFRKNVRWQTKVFAGAGLLAAGALSASASPLVLTTIGLATLAVRGISSAGTYLAIRGLLEKNYSDREKLGKTVSSVEKGLYGAGAVIIAAGVGNALGYLFESLSTVAEKGFISAKDMLDTSVPDVVKETLEEGSSHASTILSDTQQEVSSVAAQEVVAPVLEITHTVAKNENLWMILRKTLESTNYQGFSSLSQSVQEAKISLLVDEIAKNPTAYGIESGKVDVIHVNDVLTLTKLFVK